jgi:hypothetical protein
MRRGSVRRATLIVVLVLGCLASKDRLAGAAPPATAAPPTCVLDPRSLRVRNGAGAVLGGTLMRATFSTGKGIVVAEAQSGKVVATAPVPKGLDADVYKLVRTREGFVVALGLHPPEKRMATRLNLARFNADGSRHGPLVAVPESVVPVPLPDFSIAAVDDTLVLFVETARLQHSEVRLIDLNARPIGAIVDTGFGRVGWAERIGDTHSFAVSLRNHEGDPDQLRIFDVDKRTWLGPSMDLGQPNIYGAARFGAQAIVMMGVGPSGIAGATVDANGKLSPWRSWASSQSVTGHGVMTTSDGTQTFAIWSSGHGTDALVHIGTVKPDLSVAPLTPGIPGPELGPAEAFATTADLYEGDEHYRCTR